MRLNSPSQLPSLENIQASIKTKCFALLAGVMALTAAPEIANTAKSLLGPEQANLPAEIKPLVDNTREVLSAVASFAPTAQAQISGSEFDRAVRDSTTNEPAKEDRREERSEEKKPEKNDNKIEEPPSTYDPHAELEKLLEKQDFGKDKGSSIPWGPLEGVPEALLHALYLFVAARFVGANKRDFYNSGMSIGTAAMFDSIRTLFTIPFVPMAAGSYAATIHSILLKSGRLAPGTRMNDNLTRIAYYGGPVATWIIAGLDVGEETQEKIISLPWQADLGVVSIVCPIITYLLYRGYRARITGTNPTP